MALETDYVKVVADRSLMSVEYRLPLLANPLCSAVSLRQLSYSLVFIVILNTFTIQRRCYCMTVTFLETDRTLITRRRAKVTRTIPQMPNGIGMARDDGCGLEKSRPFQLSGCVMVTLYFYASVANSIAEGNKFSGGLSGAGRPLSLFTNTCLA